MGTPRPDRVTRGFRAETVQKVSHKTNVFPFAWLIYLFCFGSNGATCRVVDTVGCCTKMWSDVIWLLFKFCFQVSHVSLCLSTFQAQAWSGNSSQMESVAPCQRMSDGLPARWTLPCQGPFTSYGCPLICLMTNDYPRKRPGRPTLNPHVWIKEDFYMLHRGSLFGAEGDPSSPQRPAQFALLLQEEEERCLRRQGLIERGRSD